MATVPSDVYYSPTILGKRRFYASDLDFESSFDKRQASNTILFKQYLAELFKQSRKESEDHEWDYSIFKKGERLISSLYQDYNIRTKNLNGEEVSLRQTKWLCSTFNCILDVYDSRPRINESIQVGNKVFLVSYEYGFFCDYLLYILAKHVLSSIHIETKPPKDTSLSVLYNSSRWGERWGSEFDKWYAILFPQRLGVTNEEDQAIVFPFNNRKWTKLWLEHVVDENYRNEDYVLYYPGPDGETVVTDIAGVRPWFSDYRRRVYVLYGGLTAEEDKYKLLIDWCVNTMNLAMEVCDEHKSGKHFLTDEKTENGDSNANPFLLEVIMRSCCFHIIGLLSSLLHNISQPDAVVQESFKINKIRHDDEAQESSPNVPASIDSIPSGYLQFVIKDVGIQQKVYLFLADKVGKQPGAKEYLYLAALIQLRVIQVPEYTMLKSAFPVFNDQRYYPNFMHFFGDSGVYIDPQGRVAYKIENKCTEILKTIPELSKKA